MDAKLVVVGGDAKAAEIPLKLPVLIGRGREATLALPHPLVSRKHCQIYESGGYLMVRDLGSLNGTYVNNRRVDEAVLPPNELLTLGTVTFRAIYTPCAAGPAASSSGSTPASEPQEAAGMSGRTPSGTPLRATIALQEDHAHGHEAETIPNDMGNGENVSPDAETPPAAQ